MNLPGKLGVYLALLFWAFLVPVAENGISFLFLELSLHLSPLLAECVPASPTPTQIPCSPEA